MLDVSQFTFNVGMLYALAVGAVTYVLGWSIFSALTKNAPTDISHFCRDLKDKWMIRTLWIGVLVWGITCAWFGFRSDRKHETDQGSLKTDALSTDATDRKTKDVMGEGDRIQKSGQDSLDKFRTRVLRKTK